MVAEDTFDCAEVNMDIKMMVHMDTVTEALYTIFALAEGGNILSPLKPCPKPDDDRCCSVTKDHFGFTWIITCSNPAKQYYSDGIIWIS